MIGDRDRAPITGEGRGVDPAIVLERCPDQMASVGIPDANLEVGAARRDALAVGAEPERFT